MFIFRSGTRGIRVDIEERRGENSAYSVMMMVRVFVGHVLWESPVYSILRNDCMCKLLFLQDGFECFESLNSFERAPK